MSCNNNKWGTETLNFGRLNNLGAAAYQFRNEILPSQEVLASTMEAFEATLASAEDAEPESGSKGRKSPPRSNRLAPDDPVPLDCLPAIDGAVAIFIHHIKTVYMEVSATVLLYLQFILYVYLEVYANPSQKPVSRNWLLQATNILFHDSSKCEELFAQLAQPHLLMRLYYGLGNLVASLQKNNSLAMSPPDTEKFRTHMTNVKAAISNELTMREYLQGMEELAKLYTLEAFSFRKKLEKIAAINKLIPISARGRQLRRRLFELFPLPVPKRKSEAHLQLLFLGKNAHPDGSVALPSTLMVDDPAIAEASLPAVHVPNGKDANCILLRLRILLRAAETLSNGEQFARDVIDLHNSSMSEMSFQEKVQRLDTVVRAIPEQHSLLRAVVYNMFPISFSLADISAAVSSTAGGAVPTETVPSSAQVFQTPQTSEGSIPTSKPLNENLVKLIATDIQFTSGLESMQLLPEASAPATASAAVSSLPADAVLSEESACTTVDLVPSTAASASSNASSADLSAMSSAPLLSDEQVGEQPRKRTRTSVNSGSVMSSSSSSSSASSSSSSAPSVTSAVDNGKADTIDVSFKDLTGHKLRFKVKKRILLLKAMQAYATHIHKSIPGLRFTLGSRVLTGEEKIAELNLQENDEILVVRVVSTQEDG